MMGRMIRIRGAEQDEFLRIQEIERAAGEAFRDIGMPEIADDAPPSLEELAGYASAGLAWVAVDAQGTPVASLLAEPVEEALHIEQVSVHPDAARQGIGRRLIDHAGTHAAALGLNALTLTTFVDVVWNARYYRRIGFIDLAADQLTPGLVDVRRREAELGLDRWPRVCMVRPLDDQLPADG
ncbi:GCN5 family N-acetyltransferase [Nesterenkonia cremea]|uniref:GCN5 family N-acetyltransferase n=2 Tax=Nesterenkonia cremea TaxID=1882340 RepID=A0A917AQN5_9MICC|nr:GCN5 family N-acetyltransferase [Nesterenkonia cremea]